MKDYEDQKNQNKGNRRIYYREGKLYFDRKLERDFYFFLTMIILLWGALVKLGLLS